MERVPPTRLLSRYNNVIHCDKQHTNRHVHNVVYVCTDVSYFKNLVDPDEW